MTFAASPFAESTFAGVAGAGLATAPSGGGGSTPTVVESPFVVQVGGVALSIQSNSLRIEERFGEHGEASFALTNLAVMPAVGQPVKILYFRQLLFAGAIDRLRIRTEPSHHHTTIECLCTDHSYLLMRRKINKQYVGMTIDAIANDVVNSELLQDGITVGRVDVAMALPVATADWISAYQFLTEIATAVGAVFSIDHDKRLNFMSSTSSSSGTPLVDGNIESLDMTFDRESYRNRQTTKVTGTPRQQGETALTLELTRSSSDSIAERITVEGGGGVYNDHAAVTHPTANDVVALTRLGQAYNKTLLGVGGTIERTVSIRTRQYGYRAGQFVSLTFDHLGISGIWVIQRMQVEEEAGLFVVSSLELTQSTRVARSQELWLGMVQKGSVIVMPPSAVYTNSLIVTTPGLGSWQVPAGVTDIQVTCYGSGGGGGGGARSEFPSLGGVRTANGSDGGSGALVIAILTVRPGDVIMYWVGAGGAGGAGQYRFQSFADALGGTGATGITSWVELSGSFRVVEALGGNGGIGGVANAPRGYSNTLPAAGDGRGFGGIVQVVGGAHTLGAGGQGSNNSAGLAGLNGRIVLEW